MKASADPFETLVVTVISQNTADTNTERAFRMLQKKYPITPKALAEASLPEIEAAIKVAGLWKAKAAAIQNASRVILEKHGGNLSAVVALPVEQAREQLMAMQGVGPKTADVVLLFSACKPTIPVDTHVNRVSRRLGLAPAVGGYEAVRLSLQSRFKPENYLDVHLLLIALGRAYCKSHKPTCRTCSAAQFCPSNGRIN